MATKNREQNRTQRAAAIQAETARKERTKRFSIIGAVVVVVVVIIGAAFWATRGGGGSATASDVNVKVVRDGSAMVVGNDANAPVKVTIYEDFLCPYCRQFEASSRDFLQADAEKGKVLVTYQPIHFLQQDYSKDALNAFGQVLQNGTGAQALRFHNELYDHQPYENASSFPTANDLRDLAQDAGVSKSSVLDLIGKSDTGFYDTAQQAMETAKIQATPTIMVNGQPFGGASSVDGLAKKLEQRIAQGSGG